MAPNPIPALVRAGIPADRIVSLRGDKWAVLDKQGGGLVGLSYHEDPGESHGLPFYPWSVETQGASSYVLILFDAIRDIVEIVRNHDEAGEG